MSVLARIEERKVRFGGEQHNGWLPSEATTPSPTPTRELELTLRITDDGGDGFLLIYESSDGSLHNDNWHQTLDRAIADAEESFGITKDEWKFA